MGIINDQVKHAFDKFKENGNLSDLVMKLVCDADYSVRYAWMFAEVRDALREHCPKPVFECVYYDGEHGEYHLFDFDPNPISRECLLIEVRSRLQYECHVDPENIDRAMESVYLLNTNSLVKVVTE